MSQPSLDWTIMTYEAIGSKASIFQKEVLAFLIELREARTEITRLKEYEWMYKDLCE